MLCFSGATIQYANLTRRSPSPESQPKANVANYQKVAPTPAPALMRAFPAVES